MVSYKFLQWRLYIADWAQMGGDGGGQWRTREARGGNYGGGSREQ